MNSWRNFCSRKEKDLIGTIEDGGLGNVDQFQIF